MYKAHTFTDFSEAIDLVSFGGGPAHYVRVEDAGGGTLELTFANAATETWADGTAVYDGWDLYQQEVADLNVGIYEVGTDTDVNALYVEW